jgi:hypothetical protein
MKLLSLLVLVMTLGPTLASAAGQPMACRVDVLNARERGRRETLVRELMTKATIEERTDGYELQWKDTPKAYEKLVEFVGYERRCCPFLEFEVRVSGPDEPVTLVLHGDQDVKDFIKAVGLFEGNP